MNLVTKINEEAKSDSPWTLAELIESFAKVLYGIDDEKDN